MDGCATLSVIDRPQGRFEEISDVPYIVPCTNNKPYVLLFTWGPTQAYTQGSHSGPGKFPYGYTAVDCCLASGVPC